MATPSEPSRQERSQRTAQLLDRAHHSVEPDRGELLAEVVLLNRGVARAVAARYRGRGVGLEDLEQTAYVGLVKAVHRYDHDRGEDLLTFAVPTIRGEVQRHFRDDSWTIRPPRGVQELQHRINDAREQLADESGSEPTEAEVIGRLDVGTGAYREAVRAFGCFAPDSLDRPLPSHRSGGDTVADLVAAGGGERTSVPTERHAPENEAAEARTAIVPVIRELPDVDRRLLYLRYFEEQTQQQIGDQLDLTQVQVSRQLTRILHRLRTRLGDAA